jgi:hypothetical protein
VVADLHRVRAFCDGRLVADHDRLWSWHQTVSHPDQVTAATVLRRQRVTRLHRVTDPEVQSYIASTREEISDGSLALVPTPDHIRSSPFRLVRLPAPSQAHGRRPLRALYTTRRCWVTYLNVACRSTNGAGMATSPVNERVQQAIRARNVLQVPPNCIGDAAGTSRRTARAG